MHTRSIWCRVTWVGLFVGVGCGGTTNKDNDAGALATCGSNCSAGQVAAACSAVCDKIARAGCSQSDTADCPRSCASIPIMTPACASLADAYIRCLESAQPTCSDSGILDFFECDPAQQALLACRGDSGAFGTPPTAVGGGPASGLCDNPAADVCPSIPRPAVGLMACSGSGGAGPNAPATVPLHTLRRASTSHAALHSAV
jgi:hypothetical protein